MFKIIIKHLIEHLFLTYLYKLLKLSFKPVLKERAGFFRLSYFLIRSQDTPIAGRKQEVEPNKNKKKYDVN